MTADVVRSQKSEVGPTRILGVRRDGTVIQHQPVSAAGASKAQLSESVAGIF